MGRPLPGFADAPGAEGRWAGINPQGVAVSAFYRRSPISGWLMTIGVDRAALSASLRSSLVWLFGVTALLLLASVGVAALIMRRLTRATAAMTGAAEAMAKGQLTVVPRTGIQEVNQVGDAFAQASIRLHVQATALAPTATSSSASWSRCNVRPAWPSVAPSSATCTSPRPRWA